MNVTVTPEPEFLRAEVSGEFSLAEAERTFLEVLDAIDVQNEKVLFDGRQITGELTTMERFYYGEFVALNLSRYSEQSGHPAPQFAYVLQEPVLDPERFGETVAANRGMNVKAFDNLEAAVEWLR